MPAKDTEQFTNSLSKADDIEDFVRKHDNDFRIRKSSLVGYLQHLLEEKKLSKKQVIQESQLDEVYAYHIFAGRKNSSRENILSLALAMNLSPKETDYLLYYAGHKKIYTYNKWDSIIFFALTNHKSVLETNDFLTDLKLSPLLGKLS